MLPSMKTWRRKESERLRIRCNLGINCHNIIPADKFGSCSNASRAIICQVTIREPAERPSHDGLIADHVALTVATGAAIMKRRKTSRKPLGTIWEIPGAPWQRIEPILNDRPDLLAIVGGLTPTRGHVHSPRPAKNWVAVGSGPEPPRRPDG
jgi:hypothetical protein